MTSAVNSDLPQEYVDHLRKRGFTCETVIGRGLSGTVVRAVQESLGRSVAIKFCDSSDARASGQLRARFEREARLLAQIQHPAIPYVLTTGKTPSGTSYTVLEFIEGQSLRQLLQEKRRLAPEVALRLLVGLLDALDAAHSKDIVHRDVKPENMIVTGKSCVLIDFSIGYSRAEQVGVTRETRTGEHLGTVDYMCPEQCRDMSRVDARCDLYSVGVVLHEMLVGTPRLRPEQLDSDMTDVAVGLRALVRKACATTPGDRFQSAREFLEKALAFVGPGVVLSGDAGTALCLNHRCRQANWTQNGYYRGPRVVEDTTDSFCDSCGHALVHHCAGCGVRYRGTQFCGSCGRQWYEVPLCKICGSLLKEADMGAKTETECCTKGRRKGFGKPPPKDGYDDADYGNDIPF